MSWHNRGVSVMSDPTRKHVVEPGIQETKIFREPWPLIIFGVVVGVIHLFLVKRLDVARNRIGA